MFSDFICPWCYVGHRRLDAALAALGGEMRVEVVWRAFELNPTLPAAGVDRRAYRTAKFGSREKSQPLDAGTVEAGTLDGVEFRYDLMTRTPNTAAAHRLAWLARDAGRQPDVVDRLFRAYFTEGRDLSDTAVLDEIAAEAGLQDLKLGSSAAAGDEAGRGVAQDQDRARALGVSAVPFHVVENRYRFSGAVPAEEITRLLRQVAGEQKWQS